jgi:nicotinamidase-related amidase
MLLGNGITKVALAGVATNLVVEAAARHAVDSGLDVVVLEDLCASFATDLHEFAVTRTLPLFADVIDSERFVSSIAEGA